MLVEITGKRNDEKLVTTSRKVAEVFGKQHQHVLRDIRELKCSDEFRQSNYGQSYYLNEQNKKQPEYIITKDGFVMLVMGYSGEKAFKFKEDYIKAFNYMESELKRIHKEREQWAIEREKGKMIRHILTDTIKMKIVDSAHKKFMYPNYTKLIYKKIFGKNFNELKKEYGIKPKESLRDYITSEELKEVEQLEMLVSSLINIGWSYQEIKEFIGNDYKLKLSA